MFWLILATCAALLAYWYIVRAQNYWTRLGVPQSKPTFFFGVAWKMLTRQESAPELNERVYNEFPESRYFGLYQFLMKGLMIRDPELIKQIFVKDFDHFVDHGSLITGEADPLLTKTLFALKGPHWREMRSTLSPAFTSSKMKHMFCLMSQTAEKFVENFLEEGESLITVEMKDKLTRFANDVIANTVFGFECDSIKEPNNEFYIRGKEATDFSNFRKIAVFMGYIVFSKLLQFFKVSLFSEAMRNYFTGIIKANIESREKHGLKRPDMIGLLLEAKKNNFKQEEVTVPDTGFATVEESEIGKSQKFRKNVISDDDIVSQAFLFFFAGFDSVSSLLCFMAYELAVNQEIQERLRREVDDVREQCEGKLTYEAITSMKYMDMVVSESLRKWPNAIATDRICTKPYTIEPKLPHEKPLHLKKGDNVFLPMYAIQRDPKYYPDPERFDPERFSDENKNQIVPYTYFPFGAGPRSCIGSRFALLETKILFYYLLSGFEIIPVEKTQIPIRFDRKAINMAAEKDFWMGLKRRN